MNHHDVPINSTYFREYGIHPVKREGSEDYIASFPNWYETIAALKSDFPKKGNIITPEYAAGPEDLTGLKDSEDLIEDRIRTATELTKGSEATLHLGTPLPDMDPYGRGQWHNAVLSIQNGAIKSIAKKTNLVPVEEALGIKSPRDVQRTIKNGTAVLICAELFLYAMNPNHALKNQNVKQIIAPTMWATPLKPGENVVQVENAGGEDNYYRQQLEKAIGSYLMKDLPTVDRVVVSDRGRPDLAPYNAVFERVK